MCNAMYHPYFALKSAGLPSGVDKIGGINCTLFKEFQ